LRVTRRIVCFRHDNVNSFATINAHGTVFFNARDDHDEIFFVDELTHQCGHIVFNAMTVCRRDFLAAEPDSPLNAIAPRENERRTIYDAFHGLYTEHTMTNMMRRCDEEAIYRGRQAHELYGRLSFITRKYRVDLRNLSGDGIFTPLGREMYDYFSSAFEEVFCARRALFETDMTGQPYNFDYELFARHNPMPGDRGARSLWAVG
jgi:HEXXH motif-containing protein